MQKLAAYLLERKDDLQWPEARTSEGERIRSLIEAWLVGKGAATTSGTSEYQALDGSEAHYQVQERYDGDRSWIWYELTEVTEGRRFIANVSVTVGGSSVVLYVTLEVGSVSSQVIEIDVDPRCPRIVREVLTGEGVWYHGASRLEKLTELSGFDAGVALALELQDKARTVPFVVVSTVNGESALNGLANGLAYDLVGIANVFAVDEAASWALTDELRKPLSCYSGATRIYWPRLSRSDDPYRHHLWTAARLRGLHYDQARGLDLIRREVRTVIMRASAASVVRPREIDDIRNAESQREYQELRKKAISVADLEELADLYATENDELRRERDDLAAVADSRLGEIKDLEDQVRILRFHLSKKTGPSDDAGLGPDLPDAEAIEGPPKSGDVRFYKKTYSAPTHDVLVRVGDCGHNVWQSAASADKARKGLEKLLDDQRDWKSMRHCGKCTGGGMWRIEW